VELSSLAYYLNLQLTLWGPFRRGSGLTTRGKWGRGEVSKWRDKNSIFEMMMLDYGSSIRILYIFNLSLSNFYPFIANC